MRAAVAVLCVVLTGLALSACGGGGSSATGDKPGDGKQIFSDAGCAGCHELSAAGSNGGSGPSLNNIGLNAEAIADQVRTGGGGMPSFDGDLTGAQITAVAEFVAANDGSK